MIPVCGVLRVEFTYFPLSISSAECMVRIGSIWDYFQYDYAPVSLAGVWLNPDCGTSSSLVVHSYVPDIC